MNRNLLTMQTLLSLLLVFLINVEINAEITITFTDIESAVNWGIEKYKPRPSNISVEQTRENVNQLLQTVNQVSRSLDKLDRKIDIKLDRMLTILLADLEITAGLEQAQIELCEYINRVDDFFDNARIYIFGSSYSKKTLQQFFYSALWCHDNLPNLLENMFDLFVPGVESKGMLLMTHDRGTLHINHDCDDATSVHQKMYYTFVQVLLAEMKGLAVINQIYKTQSLFDHSPNNYTAELEYAKQQYRKRVKKYHQIFLHNMAELPRQIRRCDIDHPENNVNYIEMEQFSRVMFLDPKFARDHGCENCPSSNELETLSKIKGTHIYNCQAMGKNVTACRPGRGAVRDYMWWRTNEKTYGHDLPCDQTFNMCAESECQLCVCSEDRNNEMDDREYSVLKISALEKYSDIVDNMVVTGVRLVRNRDVLHFQVQQAKFMGNAIAESDSEWKPIIPSLNGKLLGRTRTFFPLLTSCKTVNLDDIRTPKGYVVTGVKFATVGTPPAAFEIQIHATKFNFTTGMLVPNTGKWVTSSDYPLKPDDYKRPRYHIDMGRADDPRRTSIFDYDVSANNDITFTHTDIEYDGGQTTIPLIDVQPVETHPPFPLGGIGLAYKGKEYFGGYIALRTFTVNVTEHMEYSDPAPLNKIV